VRAPRAVPGGSMGSLGSTGPLVWGEKKEKKMKQSHLPKDGATAHGAVGRDLFLFLFLKRKAAAATAIRPSASRHAWLGQCALASLSLPVAASPPSPLVGQSPRHASLFPLSYRMHDTTPTTHMAGLPPLGSAVPICLSQISPPHYFIHRSFDPISYVSIIPTHPSILRSRAQTLKLRAPSRAPWPGRGVLMTKKPEILRSPQRGSALPWFRSVPEGATSTAHPAHQSTYYATHRILLPNPNLLLLYYPVPRPSSPFPLLLPTHSRTKRKAERKLELKLGWGASPRGSWLACPPRARARRCRSRCRR